MAHFRGTMQGQRGMVSRLGSRQSGLTATANGWNFGITVYLEHVDGGDKATVYLTGGSNARETPKLLGHFTRKDIES